MYKTFTTLAAAAILAAGTSVTLAQTAATESGTQAAPRAERPRLFTDEEREQFRNRMRQIEEQRRALRKEMRDLAEQRAREKGITLPRRFDRGQEGHGMRGHHAHRGHHGHRHGMHAGFRQALALVTPEERSQFREKMKAAQTPEERAEVRKAFRGLVEQRAKEKGIELRPFGPGRRGEAGVKTPA